MAFNRIAYVFRFPFIMQWKSQFNAFNKKLVLCVDVWLVYILILPFNVVNGDIVRYNILHNVQLIRLLASSLKHKFKGTLKR